MPETAVVTLLFCDLVGSTELQQSLGDDVNDEVRRSLLAALGRAADAYGGEVVKSAGDGVMVSFRRSAADAVACGIAMQRAAAQIEHDGSPLGLELRIGISSGEASYESGDWFGNPVIEAARLEAAAKPGQILVSEVVRTIVGTRGGAHFRDAGKRDFKGFPRPVPVIEVVWRAESDPKPVRRRKKGRHRSRMFVAAAALGGVALAAIATVIIVTRDSGNADDILASGLPLVAEGYTPVLEGGECDPDWEESPDVRCEELVVPENREEPTERQIRVGVITYPSRGEIGNPPTITLGAFEDNFEESDIRQYGDFVSLDIRGGNLSTPHLNCPELAEVQRANFSRTPDEAERFWLGATDRCGKSLVAAGIDLNQYGTEDMVTDLRDLVIAKGWPQINLQAGGRWSRVAIRFAQLYPQTVRAIIVADPQPFYETQNDAIIHANRAFEAYVERCTADEDCARAFPRLEELSAENFARAEANPVTVDVPDPDGGPDIPVRLDGTLLILTLTAALDDQNALPLIASTMSATDDARLRTTAAFFVESFRLHPGLPYGLWNSQYCEDLAPTVLQSRIEASMSVYPLFAVLGTPNRVCERWPTDADSVLWNEIKVTPVPALILAGELSPSFPPAYAEAAGEAFAQPHIVVFPHLSGGVIGSGEACIVELRRAFLADPKGDLDPQPCVDSIPPIEFVGT